MQSGARSREIARRLHGATPRPSVNNVRGTRGKIRADLHFISRGVRAVSVSVAHIHDIGDRRPGKDEQRDTTSLRNHASPEAAN